MTQEETVTITISGVNSTGALKSPNYTGLYNNSNGLTKITFGHLPKRCWINLVYLPVIPQTSNDLCDEFPFDIHGDGDIQQKHGCAHNHFNEDVPIVGKWRTVDFIYVFAYVNEITLLVREKETGLGAFRLFYNSKLPLLRALRVFL